MSHSSSEMLPSSIMSGQKSLESDKILAARDNLPQNGMRSSPQYGDISMI